MKFLGIGRGARRPAGGQARHAETEEEMRNRHAREMRDAGFEQPDTADDPQDPSQGDGGDEDGRRAKTGDQMPPANDADPNDDPVEPIPAEDDDGDDDAEDREDQDIDGEPDEDARRRRRAAARKRRRSKARRAERARCAEIFAAPTAAKNVSLAAELAFNTTLRSDRAVAILNRGGDSGGLSARMAGLGTVAPLAIGSGAGSPGAREPQSIATSWDAAMKKVRNW